MLSDFLYLSHRDCALHDLHAFPTRRSSDLEPESVRAFHQRPPGHLQGQPAVAHAARFPDKRSGHGRKRPGSPARSEEHTSELQSRGHLVCRLLLEKKKNHIKPKLMQTISIY